MRGAGRVLERQEIMRGVWGENFFGDDNLLDVYIRYLRQKIERKDQPSLIHTVRGVGFISDKQRIELWPPDPFLEFTSALELQTTGRCQALNRPGRSTVRIVDLIRPKSVRT